VDPATLLIAGLAVILLLQIRRVRRQQRDVRATRSALEVGAEVLTASGMIGTVVEAAGATIVLAGEDGQRTRWVAGAVVRVLPDTDPMSSRYELPGDLGHGPDDSTGSEDRTASHDDPDPRDGTASGTTTKD